MTYIGTKAAHELKCSSHPFAPTSKVLYLLSLLCCDLRFKSIMHYVSICKYTDGAPSLFQCYNLLPVLPYQKSIEYFLVGHHNVHRFERKEKYRKNTKRNSHIEQRRPVRLPYCPLRLLRCLIP